MRTKRKIEKIIHNGRGFTLAETLLAVLIMLMVATIMTTGIPAAKNAYEKVVLASNAEVLMSTTISTLRNELSTAEKVRKSDNSIIYYSPSRGSYSKIYNSVDKGIMFSRYYYDASIMTPEEINAMVASGIIPKDEQLISSGTATENLCVGFDTVEYNIANGVVTFNDLSVYRVVNDSIVKRHYSVRVISP